MTIPETRNEETSGVERLNAMGFYSWNVQANKVHGDEVIGWVFGLSAEELAVGVPVAFAIRLIDDGDKQRVAKAIHDTIITGLPFHSEYRLTHPDGRKVRVIANGRCLRDAEGVPSIYSGTITVLPQAASSAFFDPLESHCRAALGIAKSRRDALAARYLSSALNVLGGRGGH